ncbi:MAG: DUF3617 family protein [Caulobacter sp.]|nr:DUF3617 family protein [Caulobacter sp.]
MRIAAGICLAALALAACSKPADKTNVASAGDASPAAKAASPIPPGIDAAPHLRAGLWEVTVQGMPAAARTCIDDKTQSDNAVLGQGADTRNCSRNTWRRIPGGIAFEFACDNDGMKMASKGTVTGDFNSAYRVEADLSGSRDGQAFSQKQVIDARYVGACPAGMKPGDSQVTINGRTITAPMKPAG